MPFDLGLAEKQRETWEPADDYPTGAADSVDAFRHKIAESGICPPKIVIPNEWLRWGPKKRYWAIYFDDGIPGGAFGDYKSQLSVKWCSRKRSELTAAEHQQLNTLQELARQKREKENALRHARAAESAHKLYRKGKTPKADHPYLQNKGVPAHQGVRQFGNALVVPVCNQDDDLVSLQFIGPDGKKRYLTDGEIKGGSFVIVGGPEIYIAEGYATAAIVHQATGGTVFVAFSAGNLKSVAMAIRAQHQTARITICADNDQFTVHHSGQINPGLIEGRAAAQAIGAGLAVPTFKDYRGKPTDFNDLAAREGVEAVKTQIGNARTADSRFQFIHAGDLVNNLRPIEWSIFGIQPTSSLYYTFGDPGTHKTFVELDKGLCIAAGIPYHGHATRQGTVFYICGEGQQGIGRRLAVWFIAHKLKAADVPFFVAKTPMQLSDPANVEGVMRAIDAMALQYGPPALVIIDTLARNFGDGDENSTKDMGMVIQNLDHFFGNDFNRGLIHHTGHMAKDRGRGSMALKGGVDTEFRCSMTSDDKILMECIKQKDAPKATPMLFNPREIKLLIGDTKDSSLVLDLVAEGDDIKAQPAANLSDQMVKALDILKAMGGSGEYREWRRQCIAKKLYRRTDVFDKAAKKMRKSGLVFWDLMQNEVFFQNDGPVEPGGN
jgi:phage/plasmid primase-like uncharacterized protein